MKTRMSLATLLAAAMSLPVIADDKLWSGELSLGYMQNSGNTKSTSFNGKSKAERDGEHWRNTFKLDGNNETAEDADGIESRTAENYFASGRADYKLTEESFLFGLLEYTNDRFSGFEYESTATFGYGRQLIENPQHNLKGDIGLGYRYSELEDTNTNEEDAIARLGALYIWTITENATFDEELSVEVGDDKTVSKSLTRLRLRINSSLWGSVSYEIKHNSDVPDGVKNSDRKTLLGLNYTF